MSNWNDVAYKVEFNLEIINELLTDRLPSSSQVLDFGCGYGRITNQLHGLGFKNITGVDSSLEMINRGTNEFPYLELNHVMGTPLPFPDESFDAVISCAVFTCIRDQKIRANVVSELLRILKPNGVIYLAEFCADESVLFTSGVGVPMWHGTQADIKSIVSEFKIEKSLVINNQTMTGHNSKACHVVARK
ncbi:class I SAM-dependent methyltransferase [Moritella sp. Urea-trap-13]|uniref:class I SAM-dependent methyltransferase n=1 Tax=Moritella sp. Urea-trap-13 TaxID=2058327 RepID=UPI000C33637F|nr:class I SAM-dependent methyltransferase [Moritella sp. Urea-trap-13]PKH07229.1 class I SAM-dependent methyltransferase [Moritella sp. Urea-trap-13]